MSDSIRGTAIGDVIDAVLTAARAATVAKNICDGLPEKANSGTYFCAGVDDLDTNRPADSANSQINWANSDDLSSDESGSITCVAWSQKGGTGQRKAARDEALAIVSAVKALCIAAMNGHTSDTLGVPGLWDLRVGAVDALTQAGDGNGSSAIARFTLLYQCRI